MIDTTLPKTSQSSSLKIITDLGNEEIDGGNALKGPSDYTFETLKTNFPFKSVQLSTIQKWEHQMI